MRSPAALAAVLLVLVSTASLAATGPRVVNITSDSAPGWTPSVELESQARKSVLDFLAAVDSGRFAEAYAAQGEANRGEETLTAFIQRQSTARARAGPVVERRITTVTWTKDPAKAPSPGVYAAFDLVSRFAQIDRDCGYIVLFQPPAGGPFQVSRVEETFMDNATAATIARTKSAAAVDEAWAKASAYCPGYKAPLPEAAHSSTGYASVKEALADLHSRPGVTFSTQAGWTTAEDAPAKTMWSFAPPGHPAYPSAVKRQVSEAGGTVSLDMSVLCESTKEACDDLVREFTKLNAAALGKK